MIVWKYIAFNGLPKPLNSFSNHQKYCIVINSMMFTSQIALEKYNFW